MLGDGAVDVVAENGSVLFRTTYKTNTEYRVTSATPQPAVKVCPFVITIRGACMHRRAGMYG